MHQDWTGLLPSPAGPQQEGLLPARPSGSTDPPRPNSPPPPPDPKDDAEKETEFGDMRMLMSEEYLRAMRRT